MVPSEIPARIAAGISPPQDRGFSTMAAVAPDQRDDGSDQEVDSARDHH
jgi:hypothetical protein